MTILKPLSNAHLQRYVERADLIKLTEAAIKVGSYRFARQNLLSWLAYFPGDLEAKLLFAETEFRTQNYQQSIHLASQVCDADPEILQAWELLAQIMQTANNQGIKNDSPLNLDDCFGAIAALGGKFKENRPAPAWALAVKSAADAIEQGNNEAALESIHTALLAEPLPGLVAVRHLTLTCLMKFPRKSILDLATVYHQRYPASLVTQLILAKSLIDTGESERGVALLHQAASQDVLGQVVTRLWGQNHPYQKLWPINIKAPLSLTPPAEVSALFGWNRLPEKIYGMQEVINDPENSSKKDLTSGYSHIRSSSSQKANQNQEHQRKIPDSRINSLPESLRSVQAELERIAARLKQNQLARSDGRFPVYIILSTRSGLEKQYGAKQAGLIVQEMHNLTAAINKRPDWKAQAVLVDDENLPDKMGLDPVQASDPWAIKLLLTDLDDLLAKKGEMIGALLIVGGPEVVPYHHLPNPVDDLDADVPSDNPYATRDENYFIPEWPVGRLPGGCQSDAMPLINMLKAVTRYHIEFKKKRSWANWLRTWLSLRKIMPGKRSSQSWGFTAAIWRRASLSVFRPIGDPHKLLVSPPIQVTVDGNKPKGRSFLPTGRLSYFNLHGVQDSSEWFGQKDPSEPADHPDYPVALRPQDVVNGGRAPQIVFSEACYGAHIINKSIEDALALKFLTSGSQCFVGSTCTSYGSITTPLIAADLLGHAFWKYVKDGLPCGEALRRAKIYLAKEMHRRQSFLDGEDQKTLISFIYYGDPLVQAKESSHAGRAVCRSKNPPASVKTVCERGGTCFPAGILSSAAKSAQLTGFVDAETIKQVKQIVRQYLPGMLDSSISITPAQIDCQGGDHICPTSEIGSKSRPEVVVGRKVVTLSKKISQTTTNPNAPIVHYQYLKLTLNGDGKVTKIAISR